MKATVRRPISRNADRKRALLAEPTARTWYDERSLRSVLSADVDARKLALLLERLKLDPSGIVREAKEDPDRLRSRLVRYASDMKKAGKLDTYIEKTFSGLRSYLAFRRVTFDGFPRLGSAIGTSIANERPPTPEELSRILQRLSLRGRTVALLMAHSGVRPQVLGSYRGERGLVLDDLPDLDLKTLSFREQPFVVRVRAELSKPGVAYLTMGSHESAETISTYLSDRREAGEVLKADSPLVAGATEGDLRGAARRRVRQARFRRGFMATGNVTVELARVLHASAGKGERLRPYSLRGFFSTRLMLAEGAGKITRDLREAFLGHDLKSVSRRYNLGKKWGEDVLLEARAAYKRAEPWLLTSGGAATVSAEEIQREAAVLLLTGFKGKSEADARKLVEGKSGPELADLIRSNAKPREQAVPVDEVPRLLSDGWEFVSALNGTLAVLRAPLQATPLSLSGP
jgi:integrase